MASDATSVHLQSLAAAKASLKQARIEATQLATRLKAAEKALSFEKRRHPTGTASIVTAQNTYDQAVRALSAAQSRESAAKSAAAEVFRALPSVNTQVPGPFTRLSTEYPILLTPVRLETRFKETPEGPQLWIKIYPDEFCSSGHEALLTENEQFFGKIFWNAAWSGAQTPTALDAAANWQRAQQEPWRKIVAQMPAQRAAWVVRSLTPSNYDNTRTPMASESPQFPTTLSKLDTWTQPFDAQLMPDRFVAVAALKNGRRVVTWAPNPVSHSLTLTLSPDYDPEDASKSVPLPGSGLKVSKDAAWTFDFQAALDAGMALKLQLEKGDLSQGIEKLLVFGLKESLSPTNAASELQDLFEGHHYSRGLAFVPQGTPSKNTSQVSSPVPSTDPGGQSSFGVERAESLLKSAPVAGYPASNGYVFSDALGVAAETFGNVSGADQFEQASAQHMNRVLWPATLGYFMEQMMDPVFSPDHIQGTRDYFVKWVQARGSLPCFRVGEVPYGIQPVSSLALWKTSKSDEPLSSVLATQLVPLRELWLRHASRISRVGFSSDVDKDLIQALGTEGIPQEIWMRNAFGPDSLQNMQDMQGVDASGAAFNQHLAIGAQVMVNLGHPGLQPLIRGMTFCPFEYVLDLPIVVGKTEGSTEDQAYVKWIAKADPLELRNESFQPALTQRPEALLYYYLKHAALLEFRGQGLDVLIGRGAAQLHDRIDVEMIQIIPGTELHPTIWDRMAQPVSGTPFTLSQFLVQPPANHGGLPPLIEISGYRASLNALAQLPSGELSDVFKESLSLGAYRLDAWITSLSSQRLAKMRGTRAQGLHVGAYGWVSDLKPGGTDIARNQGGYIHAPSMDHASAAAILRNAYLSRSGEDREQYAINLSSARVRKATFLLDSVRNGQPLGAVLGYLFETQLQQSKAFGFIPPLRKLYSLLSQDQVSSAQPSTSPTENIGARNVVDGLKLLRAGTSGTVPFSTDPGLMAVHDPRSAFDNALAVIRESVDALADLLNAESVYQTVRGKPMSAAATLDTVANAVRPVAPEIAQQPRDGLTLTHRVAKLLGDRTVTAPAWSPVNSPRAAAEPYINGWAANLLGDPKMIEAWVSFNDAAGQRTFMPAVTLKMLPLQPIDFLYIAAQQSSAPQGGQSDLDRMVLDYAVPLAPSGSTAFNIDYSLGPQGVDAGFQSFTQALEQARALFQVLGDSRPVLPQDFSALDASTPSSQIMNDMNSDLASRALAAILSLEGAHIQLNLSAVSIGLALDANGPYDLGLLREKLRQSARFGIPGATPVNFGVAQDAVAAAELLLQAGAVLNEAQRRLDLANEKDPDAIHYVLSPSEQIKTIFGKSFVALPVFTLDNPSASELSYALSLGPAQSQSGTATPDPFVFRKWIHKASRIRTHLSTFRDFSMLATAFGRSDPSFELAQLPANSSEAWVGLSFDSPEKRPQNSRISILLQRPADVQPGQPMAGLLIDEWSEIIPNAVEKTGIAFNYDSPASEAPQTMLLAVPPDPNQPFWSYEALESILNETWDLARIRAVDGDLLGADLGQALPGLFLADNTEGDTVSTDLSRFKLKEMRYP